MSDAREITPRLAIIGCGAIARAFHAPALRRHPEVARAALFVDADRGRAIVLAGETGGTRVATDVGEIVGHADAAIVCVPHHLHVPVCAQLLQAGIHVLCEKPLAERSGDVASLVALSAASGAALGVNNMRRAYPAMREIARRIHAGELGALRRIVVRWGEKFDWDAASGFYFGAQAHRRGALLDRGAHVLDLICWWLRGRPVVERYRDDSAGGSEAVADLVFRHGQTEGLVELSWLTKYENTIEIVGDRATIVCGIYDWTRFTIRAPGARPRTVTLPAPAATPREIGNVMMDNLLSVARGTAAPLVAGAAVVDSIAMIETAYAIREPLPQPWHDAYRRVIT